MGHKKVRKLMFITLIIIIIGCGIWYITLAPEMNIMRTAVKMIITKETPDLEPTLTRVYNPLECDEYKEQTRKSKYQYKQVELWIKQWNYTMSQKRVMIDEIQFPEVGAHYGRITCDRIALDAPVYWGDTDAILRAGVGQFIGSFLPGFDRSILLSGHNTTFFKPLQYLEVGDVIIYQTNYGEYEYKVNKIDVITAVDAQKQLDELLSFDSENLIMYTCYPFDLIFGNSSERLFVFASKISGTSVEW